MRHGHVHDLADLLLILAERAADAQPGERQRGDVLRTGTPQISEHAAVDDPEQRLVGMRHWEWQAALQRLLVEDQAARLPAMCPLQRSRGVVVAGAKRRQLVEA